MDLRFEAPFAQTSGGATASCGTVTVTDPDSGDDPAPDPGVPQLPVGDDTLLLAGGGAVLVLLILALLVI